MHNMMMIDVIEFEVTDGMMDTLDCGYIFIFYFLIGT